MTENNAIRRFMHAPDSAITNFTDMVFSHLQTSSGLGIDLSNKTKKVRVADEKVICTKCASDAITI